MKPAEEKLSVQIKVRITEREKKIIDSYCEEHEMSVSDFLRVAIRNTINQEVK